jgi:hypothetical protein
MMGTPRDYKCDAELSSKRYGLLRDFPVGETLGSFSIVDGIDVIVTVIPSTEPGCITLRLMSSQKIREVRLPRDTMIDGYLDHVVSVYVDHPYSFDAVVRSFLSVPYDARISSEFWSTSSHQMSDLTWDTDPGNLTVTASWFDDLGPVSKSAHFSSLPELWRSLHK